MKGLTGDIKSEDFAIVEPSEDHIIAQIEIEKVQSFNIIEVLNNMMCACFITLKPH